MTTSTLRTRALAWVVVGVLVPTGSLFAAPAPASGARWLRKNASGTLAVTGPSGAALAVDGVAAGVLPRTPVPLTAGRHMVELTKEGFTPLQRTLSIKPGEETRLVLDLKSMKGLLPRTTADALPLPGEAEPPPLVAAGLPLPSKASSEDGPGSALKGVRAAPPILVGQVPALARAPMPAPVRVIEAPLVVVGGELVRAEAVPQPVSARAPKPVANHPAAPPESVVAGQLQPGPLTKKWWFWGGIGAATLVVVAGVIYALPPTYVETRDPTAGCGGACGVIVNP